MSDDGALERLSKKLDSGASLSGVRRAGLFPRESSAPPGWRPDDEPEPVMKKRRRKGTLELLFIASAGFFVVAMAVAGFVLFSGGNSISTKNVDVEVTGPTEAGAGSTLSLQVVITNRNAVPMELTDLIVEFPEGTRSANEASIEMPRVRESIGTVKPGSSANRTIRAVVFGEAGATLSVKVSAEYRIPSSNAVYVRDTVYTLRINQTPASITVEGVKEAVSGQTVSFDVTLTSNAPDVLRDILLLADYPPGFSFTSAKPEPHEGSALWELGDIEPGGKRTVKISGVFTGEDGDSRVLHLTAGSRKRGDDNSISAPVAKSELVFTVTKPFVSVVLAVNGSTAGTHTVARGEKVEGEIYWTNNLPVKVENVEISLSLEGAILDRSSVQALRGFYSSGNSTILWSRGTEPSLADVAPGQSASLDFSFSTLAASQGTFRNSEVKLRVNVKAERQSESEVPETIQGGASASVLVGSDVSLAASLAHTAGPLPPKADAETTYAVTWMFANSANALADSAVSGILPSYVRFLPSPDPSLSFNPGSRILTWTIGDLTAGQTKQVTFQVGVTPSVSQVGAMPAVITSQRAYGFDRFVRSGVESTAPTVTTGSAGGSGGGTVVP